VSTSYAPGEMRIAVLGDLLRHPMTQAGEMRARLDVGDIAVLRLTLRRMIDDKGWVRRDGDRYMLTEQGRTYIHKVREWLAEETPTA
jgi:predicted transcriptional regulator